MVRINLLPPRIVEARKQRRRRMMWTSIGGVILVLVVGAYLYLLTSNVALRAELDSLEQQRATTEAEIATYAPLRALEAELEDKTVTLVRAMGRPPHWQTVLVTLGRDIPQNVWLTQLRISSRHDTNGEAEVATPTTGQIQMRGVTFNHPGTAQWIQGMHSIEHFTDIRCAFSAVQAYQGMTLVVFEMSSAVDRGEPYVIPVDGGD